MGDNGKEDARFKAALVSLIESNVATGKMVQPLMPLLEMSGSNIKLQPARTNPGARRQPGDPR
jgi:hypothetical protein